MYGLTKQEWQDLVLSVNVRKANRRLNPYKVALLIEKAIRSTTPENLASELNFKDLSTFDKIRTLAKSPEDFGELIDWGSRRGYLSMSTASELLRLSEIGSDNFREIFKKSIECELTKEEARQLIQIHKRSGKSPYDSLEETLKTRPIIQKSILILGSLLSAKAKDNAEKSIRESGMRKIYATFARKFPDISLQVFKINSSRFSLLLSEENEKKLRNAIGDISVEEVITKTIEQM
jgi:hypothetical protein